VAKAPRELVLVQGLPRTAAGKILRRRLPDLAGLSTLADSAGREAGHGPERGERNDPPAAPEAGT
jgi:hypothetical protein